MLGGMRLRSISSLIVAAALLAACGGSSTEEATPVSSVPPVTTAAPATTVADTAAPATTAAPPVTTAPATTTPPPTVAPTTAPLPTLPVEVPEGVLCIDVPPTAPVAPATSWAGLDAAAFGPLGALPALELTFPMVTVGDWDDPPILSTTSVAAGHVLLVADYPDAPGVARSDWNDSLVALIAPDGDVAWQTCVPPNWRVIAMGDDVDGVVMTDWDTDEQWRVELASGAVVAVDPPMAEPGPEPWSVPIDIGMPSDLGLVAVDGGGTEIWRDDTVYNAGGEGFYARLVDDVLLARVCLDAACMQQAIRAYRYADGTVLWTRPDHFGVPASGDGVALVNGIDAVVMVDVDTGAEVPGQRWDSPAFVQECCGGGDFAWVSRRGALVFDADYDVFRVWVPTALTAGTVSVGLPVAG